MGREFHDVEIQRPLLEEANNGDSVAAEAEATSSIKVATVEPRRLLPAEIYSNGDSPYKHSPGTSILCKAIVAIVIYFAIGTLCFYYAGDDLLGVRTQAFIDALYLCVVTLTTVGYGDLVPSSTTTKLFTCVYVFVGFGLVGVLLSGAANYLVGKQEQILEKAVYRKDRNHHCEDHLPEDDDVRSAHWKAVISGMMILVLMIMGVTFLVHYEKFTLVDAVYCVSVTVTTLGYGDRSFKTATGRLFAAIWILASTICAAQFFLYLSEVHTEHRQRRLARWVLSRKPTKVDLQNADFDKDQFVRLVF